MHYYLCKPVQLCSSLLSDRRGKQGNPPEPVIEPRAMPSLLKQLEDARAAERAESRLKRREARAARRAANPQARATERSSLRRSSSKSHQSAPREFLKVMGKVAEKVYTDHESLPTLETACARFNEMFPRYVESAAIDTLREEEYGNIKEAGRVVLDYCGFGLFSHLQQIQLWESASFALTNISVNLCSHALFGAAEAGTVEHDIKKRIMDYLNIQDTDYSMVFTASRGDTFKLLADAYPFESCHRLITMYDYESESVSWMMQRARAKGVRISNVSFKWPSLRIVSTKLRKLLVSRRRRKGPARGLFVFPAQSRVSGAKYSYQWMSLAQQNKWHVLLDASALGPKDLDSLGLSLFRPDFIIASFYKLFGADPSGFGCLFIKNTAIQSIQDASGAPATGIVRIVPLANIWSVSESSDGNPEETEEFHDAQSGQQEITDFEFHQGNQLTPVVASFSGPMLGLNKHSSSYEDFHKMPRIEGLVEEDDDSSVCESIGREVTRSPVFSEDGTDNLFCIDVGPSPVGTASRTSMSEEPFSGPLSGPFSGPFSGPIRNPMYDGGMKPSATAVSQNPLFENCQKFDRERSSTEAMGRKGVQNLKGQTNGTAEDHCEHSVSDNASEDLDVVQLSSKSKAFGKKSKQIELLDPGNSPFIGPEDSVSPGEAEDELKHEQGTSYSSASDFSPNDAQDKSDGEFAVTKMENGDLSGPLQRMPRPNNGNIMDAHVHQRRQENCLPKSGLDLHDDVNQAAGVGTELGLPQEAQKQDRFSEIEPHVSLTHEPESRQKLKEKTVWNQSESAIRRETEGEFRLLGRRHGDRFVIGRRLSPIVQDSEGSSSLAGRGAPKCSGMVDMESYFRETEKGSSSHQAEENRSEDELEEQEQWDDREPEVSCRSLDHADMLGLNKTTLRLRYLTNWLISSLLQLRHPGPENNLPLVQLYGPQIKYDRGASVAFNLYDCHGKVLHPELVQMLADRNNISLSIGFLRNLQMPDNDVDMHVFFDNKNNFTINKSSHERDHHRRSLSRIEVVTAALSVLSNFEDVYKMWVFVARFLDADFVSKELGGQHSPTEELIDLES